MTLLIASVGFAVIFDAYILSTFLEKVFLFSKSKFPNIVKISYFINPFTYLSISKFKYFSPYLNININDKDLKTFAKLALMNFNDPSNSSTYISEAREILSKNQI